MPKEGQRTEAGIGSDSESVSNDVDDADVEAALVALGQDFSAFDGLLGQQWQAKASRKRGREGAPEKPYQKARRIVRNPAAQRSPEAQAYVNKAFVKYGDGELDEAINLARHAVQLEPGDPEPFKALAVIYREKADKSKELAALEMVAYLTKPAERGGLVSTWRRIALLAQQLKRPDTALEALKRSLGSQGVHASAEDVEARWQLANLFFQREDGVQQGIKQLRRLYADTGDPRWAKEAARKYVRQRQWKPALVLLEGALESMLAQKKPVVDLDVLNMMCEVLLDKRNYGKCASTLIHVFDLTPTALKSGSAQAWPTDARTVLAYFENRAPAEFTEKLRKVNVDLASKLAASLVQLHKLDNSEISDACTTCVDLLLSHDPQDYKDVYLMVLQCFVDMVASDDGTESVAHAPHTQSYALTKKTAEYAYKLIQRLSECDASEDLREQEGLVLWQLGKAAEGASMLEEALTDMRVPRTELELCRLRVRAAAAWTQAGQPQRSSKLLSQMTYADLQQSNCLPHALSIEERMAIFGELKSWLEQYQRGVITLENVESVEEFVQKFLRLVRDCEMDFKRLQQFSSGNTVVRPPGMENDGEFGPANSQECAAEQVAVAQDEEASSAGVQKLDTTSQQGSCTRCEEIFVPGYEMPSTTNKWRRKYMGYEAIEDRIGVDGYLEFVMNGVDIAHEFAERHHARSDLEEATKSRNLELSRCVELCEMVILHRKLSAQRNPIRRQSLKSVAIGSLAMAFKARMWRTVFHHLRLFCDVREDDRPVMLANRALFAHGEDELLAGRHVRELDGFQVPPPVPSAQEAEWRRETYVSSMTDARSWAIRKLRDFPDSFAFTMVAAHFCVAAGTYKHAVPEYIRAHQQSPCDPLAALCLATSYLSLAMSRTVLYRHDMILKAFSLLQWYRRLRAGDLMNVLPGKSMIDELLHAAEAAYNFGRAFHQLSIDNLAQNSYEQSLQYMEQAETLLQSSQTDEASHARCDMATIKRCCTWNLVLLLKAHNGGARAAALLRQHISF